MTGTSDVAVIGGGLVGLATAYALTRRNPDVRVAVLEAEPALARHQSGRNSGVVHSGVYYKPGSQKAELCVEGSGRLAEFCAEHGIELRRTGKVIVASDDSEVPPLRELERRGRANGLEGLELLDRDGLRSHEPHATGVLAMFVPQAGVVDYVAVAERLAARLRADGHEIRTGFRVVEIARNGKEHLLTAADGERWSTGYLVNCAGLHSDRVAEMAGTPPPVKIMPFRGEYYVMAPERARLVRNLVYPVPDPRFPFLGVHFTRRVDGSVEVGPNAVLAFGRHHYRGEGKPDMSDTIELLRSPELWRLGARFWRTGAAEMIRSRSTKRYAAAARRLIPDVRADDLRRGGSGIRAQAVAPDGTLVDDFVLESGDHAMHVLNAPSPAATACLAIGERITDRILAAIG